MRLLIRRSSILTLTPILVVVQGYYLFSRGTPWLGEWKWTVDWVAGSVILTGPVVAALAAFETLQWSSDSSRLLLQSTPRRVPVAWQSSFVAFVLAASVQLVALVGCLIASVALGSGASWDVLAITSPFIALAAAALIGGAMATCWRNLLSAPLAAGIVYALGAFAGQIGLPSIFDTGGSTGTLVGQTWDATYLSSVAALLLIASLSMVSYIGHVDMPERAGSLRMLALVSAVAFIGGSLWLHNAGADRLRYTHKPVAFRCLDVSSTTTCLARETDRQLAWLAPRLAEASGPLHELGAAVPARFEQLVPGHALTAGAAPLILDLTVINSTRGRESDIPLMVTQPALCEQDTSGNGPGTEVFIARDLIAGWVAHQGARATDNASGVGPPVSQFLRLSPAEQAAWVRSTYDALAMCSYEVIKLPEGVSVPGGGGY